MIPNTGREWNILSVSAFLMDYKNTVFQDYFLGCLCPISIFNVSKSQDSTASGNIWHVKYEFQKSLAPFSLIVGSIWSNLIPIISGNMPEYPYFTLSNQNSWKLQLKGRKLHYNTYNIVSCKHSTEILSELTRKQDSMYASIIRCYWRFYHLHYGWGMPQEAVIYRNADYIVR